MGLDVYVGSLTRYNSGDWELIAQKVAREMGVPFQVIRPDGETSEAIPPDETKRVIFEWRNSISKALGTLLDWDESPHSPYFTDKPDFDGYMALLLWAACAEQSVPPPRWLPEDLSKDSAYARRPGRP